MNKLEDFLSNVFLESKTYKRTISAILAALAAGLVSFGKPELAEKVIVIAGLFGFTGVGYAAIKNIKK